MPRRWPAWALPEYYRRFKGTARSALADSARRLLGGGAEVGSFTPRGTGNGDQRICDVCDRLSRSFRAALIADDLPLAKSLYTRTGLVNLRSPFPHDPDRECPIHIAAQTGSIELLHWLVFECLVPTRVRTKGNLTAMDFAAVYLHVDAMSWLVRSGAGAVQDVRGGTSRTIKSRPTTVRVSLPYNYSTSTYRYCTSTVALQYRMEYKSTANTV